MEKSIDIAGEQFIASYKAGFLDLDDIESVYGSVAIFLAVEGQPHGELGGMYFEIKAHEHKGGYVETIEWFEDTYQTSYYLLPLEDRITPEDHTPVLDFCADFDWCIDSIEDLIEEGYSDISVDKVVEGVIVESVDLEYYMEQVPHLRRLEKNA